MRTVLTPSPWANCQPNISLLFGDLDFERRPQAAARAGFSAIECWWPFATANPRDRDVDRFVTAIEDAGVHLRALNFFAGNMPSGERGILSDPRRRSEFDDAVAAAIDIGRRLDVRMFNALYGNRIADLGAADQDAAALDALVYAVEQADAIDATVLIEPVSGVPAYPIKLAADALRVVTDVADAAARGRVLLLADLYHLHVNGDDVADVIDRMSRWIGHVQIADVPGRHEPGTGQAPLTEWVAALTRAGYTGAIGLEYVPSADTVAGLRWLFDPTSVPTAPTAYETGNPL